MKRFILCLLACLMMVPAALAQDNVLLEHGDSFFACDLVVAGDTLYMLAEQDGVAMTIAAWRPGQAEPVVADAPINYALYMQLENALVVDDGSRIVTRLFTDGQRLMSFDPVLGVVFEIRMDQGSITYHDVVVVSDPRVLYWDAYGYAKTLIHAAASGNTLYWLTAEWDDDGVQQNTIYTVNLSSGSVSQLSVTGVTDFDLLPDGRLLVLQDASALAYVDPATDAAVPAGTFGPVEVYDILHAQAMDAVIYLENQRVMGMNAAHTVTQYAYSPVEPIDAAVFGDCIAVTDGTTTVLRPLREGYQPAVELTAMSGGYENQTAVLRYNAEHPDTAVYWYQDNSGYLFDNSYDALLPMLAEQQLDIAVVTVNASGFEKLAAEGWCADLSGYTALAEKLDTMHPAFREAVTLNGQYVAVPLSASSWGWYYDPYLLEQTSLTADELPTNLVDLCAFITRWNNELMTQYPDISLFTYVDNTRSFVLGAMMEQYSVWCWKQHGQLTFDTPEFRTLLAAVKAMECDRIDRATAENYYYGTGLLGNDFASVGSFEWADAMHYGTASWLPMALTAGTPRMEPVVLEVAFVSSACEAPEAAADLLASMLNDLSDTLTHTLFADATEAVPNPYYDVWYEEATGYLYQLEAERAAAGDLGSEYDEMIVAQQYYIDNDLPQMAWIITAEDIAFYQESIAPYMGVLRANCVSNWLSESYMECYALTERYIRDEITQEQLIRELNAMP